jgi:uncharacterized membrane protein YqjE
MSTSETASKETAESSSDENTKDMLSVMRKLRSASGALLTQLTLHADLVSVEWAEEKIRLQKMMMITFFGFACLLGGLLFLGVLILLFTWDTPYRIPAAIALIAIYALGAGIAWHYVRLLSVQGEQAFAATREEFAADIALLRGKL